MGAGRGSVLAFAGWWALLLGLWLALANKATASEFTAGAIAAAIGAVAAVSVRREAVPPPLRRIARPVAAVPRDLWRLGRALAPALRGHPPAGTLETAPLAGREALASALGSIAPNSIVVAVDEEHRRVLVHRLVPEEPE